MATDNIVIEEITASLVREYLSRKGLKSALLLMDEEMPRTENSISNRQALMKELQLEKLMKRNKEMDPPLRAMLEVMTKAFLDRRENSNVSNSSPTNHAETLKYPSLQRDSNFEIMPVPVTDANNTSKSRPASAKAHRKGKRCSDLGHGDDLPGEVWNHPPS